MSELRFIKLPNVEGKNFIKSGNPCRPTVTFVESGTTKIVSEKEGHPDEGLSNWPEWVCGTLRTPVGNVFRVTTEWTWADHLGQIKCRISQFRMKYSVQPGLYAVGKPDQKSDVLVSANYKLSFDMLRRSLRGLSAWILVLDTEGINVWCAAGKGTFGTNELIRRIFEVQLERLVNHKRIVVPQLGATGVNAMAVKQNTGFKVYFGPVYARNIPAYLEAGYKAAREMRLIKFGILDRLVLTPMEINPVMKKFLIYALIVLILFGIQPLGILFSDAWSGGLPFLILGLITVFAGAFVTPVLLPFIPSRSFAVKGWITGLFVVFLLQHFAGILDQTSMILLVFTYIFFPLACSYIALQFTGSTTFTSMSGVKKELKFAMPVYISSAVLSVLLMIAYKLGQWGIV